jgi:hypothetical protein
MKFKLKHAKFNKIFKTLPIKDGKCPAGFATVQGQCIKIQSKYRRYAGLFEPSLVLQIKLDGKTPNRFTSIRFNEDNIVLTTQDGASHQFGLAANEKIGSQYVMQRTVK